VDQQAPRAASDEMIQGRDGTLDRFASLAMTGAGGGALPPKRQQKDDRNRHAEQPEQN
jgi:hypothetical protein